MAFSKRSIFIGYLNVLFITLVVTLVVLRVQHAERLKRSREPTRGLDENLNIVGGDVNITCTPTRDPVHRNAQCGNGKCVLWASTGYAYALYQSYGPTICACADGYSHLFKPCDYQRKPQLNTWFASFFGGIGGADWFYLYAGVGGNGGYPVAGAFKVLTGGMFSIWCMVDWIRVLAHGFNDSRGMALYENLTGETQYHHQGTNSQDRWSGPDVWVP
eukprot:TRINITY_DN2401_c0_g2_i3.p1 TRINITY_DN2401_c0_g2~~TRINITY_DN2401_c0_g2_i3.p1  ORF type:complete len:217 (-),score=17.16 TRINITY_DN2401_c0_g2_i3:67-717(-)